MSALRSLLRPATRHLRPIRDLLLWVLRDRRRWMKVKQLGLFDAEWYASAHCDVRDSGADPFEHYIIHGWREGRVPSERFRLVRVVPALKSLEPQGGNPLLRILELVECGRLSESELEPLRRPVRAHRRVAHATHREGVLLSGYLHAEIGLGQAARLLSHAMDMARVPLSLRDVPIPGRDRQRGFETKESADGRRVGLWVMGMEAAGARRYPGAEVGRRVLYPYWELASVPQAWHAAIREFDGVWAPSSIVAGALRSMGIDAPLVRQPVIIPPESSLVPISGASEPLSVLTYLDFDSFSARKNVRAAVTAFRTAFPRGNRARMTVKVRGTGGAADRAWLASQVEDDGRIELIDATLQWHEVDALVRGCDVFVSLHRSEGFGFGAAEALVHAKAVVSTDYGGTVDFITHETGYPVSCTMIPVGRGEYVDWQGQRWADPSIEHAAEMLRQIDRDRSAAAAKGHAGRAWMAAHHAPAVVGCVIRELLARESDG